jgi:hypothetical protein
MTKAPRNTGSARAARERPRDRGPTASSNSRRVTSWTGWPISCRHRGSVGTACRLETSQGCSPRITSSGPQSRPMTKGNARKWRDAATDEHAVGGHAARRDTTGTRGKRTARRGPGAGSTRLTSSSSVGPCLRTCHWRGSPSLAGYGSECRQDAEAKRTAAERVQAALGRIGPVRFTRARTLPPSARRGRCGSRTASATGTAARG